MEIAEFLKTDPTCDFTAVVPKGFTFSSLYEQSLPQVTESVSDLRPERTEATPEEIEHHNATHGLLPSELSPAPIERKKVVLTEQQEEAVAKILAWLQNSPKLEFRLGGPAGTGKTTLIKALMERVSLPTEIVSFTGKAVAVLRKKGLYNARTLHSLLYKAHKDPDGKIHWIPRSHLPDCKFVIVDEASMISTDLYNDLKAHCIKMLFVGDPFQLEPVGDNPNLLHELDCMLTEIHRQAKESPILRLATAVRNGLDRIPVGTWERDSSSLYVVERIDEIDDRFDAIVCGKNVTRHRINALRRKQRGYGDVLHEGETVLCLKNAADYGVFNGMTFKVKKIHKTALYMGVGKIVADLEDDLGQEYPDIPIQGEFFGKDYKRDKDTNRNAIPFDYGYALTAHKSQGSEWDNVLVIDEPTWGCDSNRWRYTAITRSAKNLTFAL